MWEACGTWRSHRNIDNCDINIGNACSPRLAALILTRALPSVHRDAILGDLAEVFASRVVADGRVAAWIWYWLTAVAMTAAFVRERGLVARTPGTTPGGTMRGVATDMRYAWRMVLRNPWMSAVAAVSLAGAMAVTIAGFSLFWDSYYAELPFAHADRLVAVRDLDERRGGSPSPRLGVVREWRAHQRSLDVIGAAYSRPREIADGAGGLVRYPVSTMTASGFRVTGVEPLYGRALWDADEAQGAEPVVVLGHRAWTTLFGSDPLAVGRTLDVDGEMRRIVGVMPEGFRFPLSEDRWIRVFGRLAPGATMEQAEAELESIRAGYAAAHPEDTELGDRRATIIPYVQSETEAGAEAMFFAMFAFMLLILSVACASVANLLLCRTMARRGEIAVRAAMGASRARLVSQLLLEALLITSVAALIGVGAAALGLRWFNAWIPVENLPFWVRFGISPPTVVFAVLASFVAAVLAGIAPALRATGGALADVLKDQQRGASGVRFGAVSGALTVAEISIAVAFLAAAGLAGRSLLDATGASAALAGHETLVADVRIADDYSVRPDGTVAVPAGDIPAERWPALAEEVRLAVAALPGVRAAALATALPMRQHRGGEIEIDGPARGEPPAGVRVLETEVTPEHFEVFGGHLLAGRLLGRSDTRASEPVVVVNRPLVERLFGVENPVGRRIRPVTTTTGPWLSIVGVVDGVPMNPAGDRQPGYYRAFAQGHGATFSLAARVDGTPTALAAAVKQAVRRIDDRLDVAGLETHAEMAERMFVSYKMMSLTFVGLGGTTLFLAVLGLYAVMSFSVTARTREIGIRLALGAGGARVATAILQRGLRQIALGLLLGSAGGWALMRLLSSIPIGMSASGPQLLVMAAGTMAAAGMLACFVPMLRTLRVHPVEALRHD